MNKNELKKIVSEAIDASQDKIIAIAEKILKNPEMGYKEFKTSALVKETFSELGIAYRDGLAITGVKGRMKGKKSDVTVCVMGELDAVISKTNPDANPETGAAHACGHNGQIANMLGAAFGLKEISQELFGDVCFFAVPAEEFVELGEREALVNEGKIKYLGGKQELIRLGEFDDVDMAMMVHAHGNDGEAMVAVDGGSLGFVAKTIDFYGKATHGSTPYEGVNALNAATLALACIHAQRETFRDEDKVRIHPIITNGGELVNVVPANATIETYVRAASFEAIKDASMKVDRAVEGAAYAVGAKSKVKNFKGYLPLKQSVKLSEVFAENAKNFVPEDRIYHGINMTGSSDVGDLSHLIPTIQPTVGGFVGALHSAEFKASDKYLAYVIPAKIMAYTVIDLLADEAKLAKKIKSEFTPLLTKEEYYKI